MATYLLINDQNANTWQYGVSDAGVLSPTSVAQQTPAAIYLNDAATNTTSWLLAVALDAQGQPHLQRQSQSYNSSYPTAIVLISPSGFVYLLQVNSSGVLSQVGFIADDDFVSIAPATVPEPIVAVWM